MDRLRCTWLLLGLVSITSAGCCCVQGVPSRGDCGAGACDTGFGPAGGLAPGPLASLISCRGACGEVYVDEWISEPPTVDNCGYNDCGDCGRCGQCRPVRSILKLLWGRPYMTSCSTDLCGPSCDGGCGANAAYETYGGDDSSQAPGTNRPQPMPDSIPYTLPPEIPMEVAPEAVPTPAPIAPSSAKRLNPAKRYKNVRRATASR